MPTVSQHEFDRYEVFIRFEVEATCRESAEEWATHIANRAKLPEPHVEAIRIHRTTKKHGGLMLVPRGE